MAVSDSYLTFVLEQLAGVPKVVTKRMFGGVGIYSGESFFAVIDNDTLFFKVDDELRPTYVKHGMAPFQPSAKQTLKSYYEVPVEVVEDDEQLADWARRAVVRI